MGSESSEEEEEVIEEGISEEERVLRQLDKQNMKLETKARGDSENYPVSIIVCCLLFVFWSRICL